MEKCAEIIARQAMKRLRLDTAGARRCAADAIETMAGAAAIRLRRS